MPHSYAGESSSCPKPSSAREVLECIRSMTPELVSARLGVSQAQSLVDRAEQIPNPEMQLQAGFGKSDVGDSSDQYSIVVEQPIELGGKRSSRIASSEYFAERSQKQLTVDESKTVIEALISLHRLRQLRSEKTTLGEAISTFEQLTLQFSRRPSLTPDQAVSQSVYRIAKSDYELRMMDLVEEELNILKHLKLSSRLREDELLNALPKEVSFWPEFPSFDGPLNLLSPMAQVKQADLKKAEAELGAARAEAWPDFSVGPLLQSQRDGLTRTQNYGFSLTLGLPFWNQNGGGRAAAAKALEQSAYEARAQTLNDGFEFKRLLSLYQESCKSLRSVPDAQELNRKHERLENQILKGLVTSSLVIESHRGLADLQKSRNVRELKTIEALWSIYLIQGRVLNELAQAKELGQ